MYAKREFDIMVLFEARTQAPPAEPTPVTPDSAVATSVFYNFIVHFMVRDNL